MSKISISKDKQARINIPKEIMKVKGWDSETEILITPLFLTPSSEITKDTPLIIVEAKKNKKRL